MAIIFAFCLIPLLAAIGGAVDFSRYYDTRAALQNALDASVLAGAAENSATIAATTFNSWNVSVGSGAVTLTSASYTGCTSSDTTCTGTYTGSVSTYFAAIIGMKSIPLTVTATAEKSAGTTTNGVCLLVKDPSSSDTFYVNGTINAAQCEIDVLTNSTASAVIDGTINAAKICLKGSASTNKKPANYYTNCSTNSDIYAGVLPAISNASCNSASGEDTENVNGGAVVIPAGTHCEHITLNGSGTVTLNPGVYGGGITIQGPNVTLAPGVYIIKNAQWVFNGGTHSGTGVTFYFADTAASFKFNGGYTTFSAPTSGTYSGILMYEPVGLSTSNWPDMNVGGTWNGLVYLPSRNFKLNSGALIETGSMVFNQINIQGAVLSLTPSSTSIGASSVVRLKK
ncbi:MAG: pilus assembly protein TadG-related protein [Rhizomicrobium sp.]